MEGQILTSEQIEAGRDTLLPPDKIRLTGNQVDDLVSIFRAYLGELASSYALVSTFENISDTEYSSKCAKLAACLMLWQDNQFDVSGFAATVANKTGFYDSTDEENFRIFCYAFGLFWDLPYEVASRFQKKPQSRFSQGFFNRV